MRVFGQFVAGLLAAGYAAMLVGAVWAHVSSVQDEFTAPWIPWLGGYFLVFPAALLLLPFAAAATRTIPVGAAILVLMTWWGYESLSIAGSFNSVWTTALATAGWIWIAATALTTGKAQPR